MYSKYILGQPLANATTINADCEAHVYGTPGQPGIAFVSNVNAQREYTVDFAGQSWTLPAWSVTLVDTATLKVLFCTAVLTKPLNDGLQRLALAVEGEKAVARANADTISYIAEPIGVSLSTVNKTASPPEQFSITHDDTDFLWHQTSVTVSAADIAAGYLNLTLTDTNEFVYVYFNSQPLIHGFGKNINGRGQHFVIPLAGLTPGAYLLQLLVVTMGAQNCCGGLEAFTRGIEGRVTLQGRDITQAGWTVQAGLKGEAENYPETGVWKTGLSPFTPLTWYKLTIPTPQPSSSPLPSWQLDLGGLGKGLLEING